MPRRGGSLFKLGGLLVVGILVLVGIAAAAWWKKTPPNNSQSSSSDPATTSAERVDGMPDTLKLPSEVIKRLGVKVARIKKLTAARQLEPPHTPTDGWTDEQVQE